MAKSKTDARDPQYDVNNNPTDTLTTKNPSLSLPYVRYFTSIMEEYRELNKGKSVKEVQKSHNSSIFPTYLPYKPYKAINSFPSMKVYEGDTTFTKTIALEEENKNDQTLLKNALGKDKDIRTISKPNVNNTNPFHGKAKSSDIILTYRSITSDISAYRLSHGLYGGGQKNSYELMTAIIQHLTQLCMLKMTTSTAIGNNGTIFSFINQLFHSRIVDTFLDTNTSNLKNETMSEFMGNSKESRKDFMKKNAKKAIITVRDSIKPEMGKDREAVEFIKKSKTIMNNLNDNIDNINLNKKDYYNNSYIIPQAAIFTIMLHSIKEIMKVYEVTYSKSSIPIFMFNMNIKALETIIDMLIYVLDLEDIFDKTNIPDFINKSNVGTLSLTAKDIFTSFHNIMANRIGSEIERMKKTETNEEAQTLYNERYRSRYESQLTKIINLIYNLNRLKNIDESPEDIISRKYKLSFEDNKDWESKLKALIKMYNDDIKNETDAQPIIDKINEKANDYNISAQALALVFCANSNIFKSYSTKATPSDSVKISVNKVT